MESFLAAPFPLAVEDENFVIVENGNEPAAPFAAPPGDFLAIMGAIKVMRDEMRNDIWDDLAALENQLGKSWSEELVPFEDIRFFFTPVKPGYQLAQLPQNSRPTPFVLLCGVYLGGSHAPLGRVESDNRLSGPTVWPIKDHRGLKFQVARR